MTSDPTQSDSSSSRPFEVFFAYARQDEDLRDLLEVHLSSLKREGAITSWHDRRIDPGLDWDSQIDSHLNSADLILLLVSSDFINSDYCWGIEVRRAMERHEAREALVIPVILRPVDWANTLFAKLQTLPKDALPVTRWEDKDEAFLDIVRGIRRSVERLRKNEAYRSTSADQPVSHLATATEYIEYIEEELDEEGRPIRRRVIRWWRSLPSSAQVILIAASIGLVGSLLAPVVDNVLSSILDRPTATPTPTVTATSTSRPSSTPTPTSTVTPSDTPSPSPTPTPSLPPTKPPSDTIELSELMFDACGPAEDDRWGEYVELFNYGDTEVDISGYWITNGHPQRLVPWLEVSRYSPIYGVQLENQSTTVIAPRHFAMIVPPEYLFYSRPYIIPSDTVVLTVDPANGLRLGGPGGFVGSSEDLATRDVLILYRGTDEQVFSVVSTYGTPKDPSAVHDPREVEDDGLDQIPYLQGDCTSIERRIPSQRDIEQNWGWVFRGSPGYSSFFTPTPTPEPNQTNG